MANHALVGLVRLHDCNVSSVQCCSVDKVLPVVDLARDRRSTSRSLETIHGARDHCECHILDTRSVMGAVSRGLAPA